MLSSAINKTENKTQKIINVVATELVLTAEIAALVGIRS